MAGRAEEVRLPLSVEKTIERICLEKNVEPLKDYARKMLALIGEEASVEILTKVLSAAKLTSFSGYVSFLVKKAFPIQADAVLSAYDPCQASPETKKTWSPSYTSPFSSPQPKADQSVQSRESGFQMNYAASNLCSSSPRNINRQLSFEDGNSESGGSNVRYMSSFSGNGSLRSPESVFRMNSTSSNLRSSSPFNINRQLTSEDSEAESGRSPNVRYMSSFSRENSRENLQSHGSGFRMNSTSPNLCSTSPRNINRQRSFADRGPESGTPNSAHASLFSGEHKGTKKPMSASPQLLILRKLEFRRLFLVLSYIGSQKLEEVIDEDGANEIFGMKDLPMSIFENKIWNKYGEAFCDESDRSLYLDWNSGKTHLYYVHVEQDGSYYFKGPYLNRSGTHLQRAAGDDNVLIVKFPDDDTCGFGNIPSEGILIGLRRYEFIVFKDEQKRAKKNQVAEEKKANSFVKCYFIRVGPDGEDDNYIFADKTIDQIRCCFMHIHTVPSLRKYNARLSLILSKTVKLQVNLSAVVVEWIDDIYFQDRKGSYVYDKDGKRVVHTDGTGYISEDLAIKCQRDYLAAKYAKDGGFEVYDDFVDFADVAPQNRGAGAMAKDVPLLIQCRLFYDGYAVKGTLLINKKLEPGTIQIRHSMIKVERDPTLPVDETFNSLEIVKISNRPGRTSLSKNLIALLSYGGVPQEFFLNLLTDTLEETRNLYSQRRGALRVASNHEGLEYGFVAKRMILCGIPLNEPYLQHCLSYLEHGEKAKLKDGKIPINDSFYLMGTADPTGVLENDEVCVILESGQISGNVLVYRNPGMHFGDIHVMKAVYVKELEEYVGNAKFGIFFSTKGSRSAAYEMASGDFDGDLYWVSRHPELLKYYEASSPWSPFYHSKSRNRGPKEFSSVELQQELFQLFWEARRPSFDMATACHSWLAYMDQLLTLGDDCLKKKEILRRKMNQLTDIYYDALDAPKSGKVINFPKDLVAKEYPHYMGRPFSYESSSILGQIYDRVEAFKHESLPKKEIWKLPCFDEPIPEVYVNMWKARYENYRRDMRAALTTDDESRNEAANDVIIKYKKLLYNDVLEMEESSKDTETIYEEARAIYHVVYDYAINLNNDIAKCNFAWRVAGSALCDWCAWQFACPKEKPLVILPSVLHDLLN